MLCLCVSKVVSNDVRCVRLINVEGSIAHSPHGRTGTLRRPRNHADNADSANNGSEETSTERGAAHASYAINELFLEYLQFSGMNHTASVFLRESGHSRRSGDGKEELAK